MTTRRPIAILLAASVTFTQTAQAFSLPHLPHNYTATNYTSHTHTEKLQTDGFETGGHVFDDRRKNNKLEEVNQTALVGTLQSQGDITTRSGRDTLIQASVLDAQGAIDLTAGSDQQQGKVTFQGVKDSHYLSVADQHNSVGWQATTGHGDYTETLKIANLTAGKGLTVNATGGIEVEIAQPAATPGDQSLAAVAAVAAAQAQTASLTPQQALSKQIDDLSKKPGQEWLAQLAKRNDVKWNQVKLAAEHWDYAHEGLSAEGAAILAIVVTAVTYGAASEAAGAMVGAAEGATTIASAALTAGMTTLASIAAGTYLFGTAVGDRPGQRGCGHGVDE